MSIFKKKILKICIILLGGIILFHIVFVSSKRYTVNLNGAKITNLSEKQYFSIAAHIPYLYEGHQIPWVNLIKSTKVNYLFDLPESTIYFIYSVYFFLFMAFVIFYSGSLFDRAKVKGTLKRQSIPKAPDKNVDYDDLLAQDPQKAFVELTKEFGADRAKGIMDSQQKDIKDEIAKLEKKKTISINEMVNNQRLIDGYNNQLNALSNVNTSNSKTPIRQPRGKDTHPNTHIGGRRVPVDVSWVKDFMPKEWVKDFMPKEPEIKDLGEFLSDNYKKGYYKKLRKYISDFAEKLGVKQP